MKKSILIPTFNSAATIGATLDSIQQQLSMHSKISAVYLADDCSSDDTIAIAKASWRSQTPLIAITGHRNLGERGNVNRAVGCLDKDIEWILLLHADDIAKPNWLDLMISQITSCSPEVASICSSWDVLLPDGSIVTGEDDLARSVERIDGCSAAIRSTLLRGCWWHISGCAIRLAAFRDIGDFNPALPQLGDWEWLLRCLARGWAVEYIPRTLILYRQHQKSVSSNSFRSNRDILEGLHILRQYREFLSRSEMVQFHAQKIKYLFRRMGRSLLDRNIKKLVVSVKTFWFVFASLLKCFI